jgi:hypothetical protein
MGPQYQATVDSYAASPQAAQSAGNQTLGKAMEQSPLHNGFGTGSSMYDNDMGKGYQPAPIAQPPMPQNQPSTAGITPSWAQEQKPLKKGGRAKRADGGNAVFGSPSGLAAFNAPNSATGFSDASLPEFGSMYNQPNSLMMTGDTLNRFAAAGLLPNQNTAVNPGAPTPNAPSPPSQQQPMLPPDVMYQSYYENPVANLYNKGLANEDLVNALYSKGLNRAPDAAGQQYWLDQLNSGKMGQQEVENTFLYSPEANKNFINQLYQSDLGRAPDQTGADYWQNQLNKNQMSRADVQRAFLNSKEGVPYQMSQGVLPEKSGSVDPFVAQYNAAIGNAQNVYGNMAQQNFFSNQAQKSAYDAALAELQKTSAQRVTEAQTLKEKQDAEARAAEAERQRLLLFLMFNK